MAKTDFQQYVCQPFCAFFKPGEKEELACQGALVVERLAASGRFDPSMIPAQRKRPELWSRPDPALTKAVCDRCSFRIDGCDFRAAIAGAEPCGGYLLLRIMQVDGWLGGDDPAEVADGWD